MGKKMEIVKARAIIKEYSSNGFKQGKALEKFGYAKTTQNAMSGTVINTALHRIIEVDRILLMESNNPKATILQMVGVTPEQVIGEYMYIASQNKDLTNKLKALVPLLKELGVVWDDKPIVNAPTLNLTVKEVSTTPKDTAPERLNTAVELVSHNIHCRPFGETAQHSPIVDNELDNGLAEPYLAEGGFGSPSQDKKEGESPPSNFVENSVIDNHDIVLPSNE